MTSVLVYGEIVEYLQGLVDFPRREAQLREALRQIYPYPITYAVLRRYASLRREMRSPHGPGIIGDMDTLIAATALEHDCVVVTLDGDFLGVPDLRVQRLDRADL